MIDAFVGNFGQWQMSLDNNNRFHICGFHCTTARKGLRILQAALVIRGLGFGIRDFDYSRKKEPRITR